MPPLYKPGDLVWARAKIACAGVAKGEYAGVVVHKCNCWLASQCCDGGYEVSGIPLPRGHTHACVATNNLRPRRDDYQQHEPRVSQAELDSVIRTEGPVDA